jgi:hypothetical protein
MEILLWLLMILVFVASRKTPTGRRRADLMTLVVMLSMAYFATYVH